MADLDTAAECQLDPAALGPQIARYRRLAAHVTRIDRDVGEVRVQFDDRVPAGLLGHTLTVERDCCPFVGIEYDAASRALALTVATVAQGPGLNSLAALLAPPPTSERTGS